MSRRRSRGDDGARAATPPEEPRDPDGASLWEHTARSVEPLKRGKPRVPRIAGATAERRPEALTKAVPAQLEAAAQAPGLAGSSRPPQRSGSEPPPLAIFDRRRARRIAAGHREIEARIDLHGMRQSEAYPRLVSFLTHCAGRGLSTVLVITGKGARPDDEPAAGAKGFERSERGVLRRMVPLWLSEPALRQLVTSFTAAALRHGGDGAFYVHLRRKRGRPNSD